MKLFTTKNDMIYNSFHQNLNLNISNDASLYRLTSLFEFKLFVEKENIYDGNIFHFGRSRPSKHRLELMTPSVDHMYVWHERPQSRNTIDMLNGLFISISSH